MANTADRRIRDRVLLALAVLVAIIPLTAGHPWHPAVGASAVVPGVGIADIAVGEPIAEVLSRFGTPSVVRLTGGDGLVGYGFDRYGITVYAHGDVVKAVSTTNSVVGAADGIRLGTPLSEIVRALGDVYSPGLVEGFSGVIYGGTGVAFGLDHGAVAAIMVFSPAGGAIPGQPASPASPASAVTSQGSVTSPAAAANAGGSSPVPDVSNLKAFTAATHFLSLSGYLRVIVHDTSKTLITPEDADRLMRQASRIGTP
jgi:hypothetical protein